MPPFSFQMPQVMATIPLSLGKPSLVDQIPVGQQNNIHILVAFFQPSNNVVYLTSTSLLVHH
jgi:ABC-type uncharacterized transport system ATPase subunit